MIDENDQWTSAEWPAASRVVPGRRAVKAAPSIITVACRCGKAVVREAVATPQESPAAHVQGACFRAKRSSRRGEIAPALQMRTRLLSVEHGETRRSLASSSGRTTLTVYSKHCNSSGKGIHFSACLSACFCSNYPGSIVFASYNHYFQRIFSF